PDWFLDELVDLLRENHFVSVHLVTILCELDHAGYSVKKLKWIAVEQSKEKQSTFVYHMGQYTPDQFGFLDETLKDKRLLGDGKEEQRRERGQREGRSLSVGIVCWEPVSSQ
ncbi:hypothetical protein L208DRAFT_1286090, partial [Tricholoma matsutake]